MLSSATLPCPKVSMRTNLMISRAQCPPSLLSSSRCTFGQRPCLLRITRVRITRALHTTPLRLHMVCLPGSIQTGLQFIGVTECLLLTKSHGG